jgi:hypothetical protein
VNGWEWVLLAAVLVVAFLGLRSWYRDALTGERAWGCFTLTGAAVWVALLIASVRLVGPYWPAGDGWLWVAAMLLVTVLPICVMGSLFFLAVKFLDKKEGL